MSTYTLIFKKDFSSANTKILTITPENQTGFAKAVIISFLLFAICAFNFFKAQATGLYVASGTTLAVDGDATVDGDLTEIDGTIQLASAGTVFQTQGLTVDGDVATAGHDDATIRLSGGTLTGTSAFTIPNKLDISGNVTMAQDVTVDNVVSTGANKLTLGGKTLTLSSTSNAMLTSSAGGGIVSENTGLTSKLKWNIGTTTTAHNFNFVTSGGSDIPVTVTGLGTDLGYITISSYASAANNTPRPTGVNHVSGLPQKAVDRFWQVDRSTGSGNADIVFTYAAGETPADGETDMRIQDYNTGTNEWSSPLAGQSNSTASNTMTVPGFNKFGLKITGSNGGGSLGSAPLPVELTKFEATCNDDQVSIHWTTASEINNYGFQIERSLDAINFAMIAEQLVPEAEANSTTPKQYFAIDAAPLGGSSYYRLKQIDINGAYEYSNAVSVTCGQKTGFDITSAATNMEDQSITVTFNTDESEIIYYMLIDYRGQRIADQSMNAKTGANQVKISTSGINKGIYLLSIKNKQKTITDKIVVQ